MNKSNKPVVNSLAPGEPKIHTIFTSTIHVASYADIPRAHHASTAFVLCALVSVLKRFDSKAFDVFVTDGCVVVIRWTYPKHLQ